jgi:MFS family permease
VRTVDSPNRLSALRFVLAFGVVSLLADFVYEGARSVVGPFLATFGASAGLVGFITGVGEAAALVSRFWTGKLSDRTRRHWALSILGYVITVVSVPLLATAWALWPAAVLVVAERFGKAVRTPARDTMLAQASSNVRRGRAFALHEALDQSGALVGPLVVAGAVAVSGFRLGFAVLAVPGLAVLTALWWLRRAVPVPADYERAAAPDRPHEGGGPLPATFWWYAGFTALNMTGYATFAVLAYHLHARHVVSDAEIPVIYALAMGMAAIAALGSGWVYDRVGLRGLVVVPVLTGAVPFLSFSTEVALVWLGAALWGAAVGVHESTMRAAVADLVTVARRGAGYGTFTAIYGLAWLAGSTAIGVLYSHSTSAATTFIVVLQVAALLAFVLVARRVKDG